MDMANDMETWTKTWKHGRGHGNMEEDMETWTRTCIVDIETLRHRHGHRDTWTRGHMESWTHRHMEISRHGDMDIDTWTWRYGIKIFGRFYIIHLTFGHRANGSLSFVCLLTKKQMEVIHLQTD